jgi:hypothetical protein
LIERKKDPYDTLFKILQRTDYFVSYIREDYELYVDSIGKDFDFFHCEINTIEQYLAGNTDTSIKRGAKNILIGNSNSIESNHLDVISHLAASKKVIKDSEVHIILSYGENNSYKNEVISALEKTFGENGTPLLEFMSREDYIDYLSQFSVAIFYHFRQQAMGNIIALLYMGVRIYMSKENPAFHYFIRNGLQVYELQDEFKKYGTTLLSEEDKLKNREIINSLFSVENVLENTRLLTLALTEND